MRVYIEMVRFDLSDDTKETVYEGPALLNGSRLLYAEEDTKARTSVTFGEEEIILRREAETGSLIRLFHDREGECEVTSAYGNMRFSAELLSFEKTESLWSAAYRLYSEQGTVSAQKIVWKLKKFN